MNRFKTNIRFDPFRKEKLTTVLDKSIFDVIDHYNEQLIKINQLIKTIEKTSSGSENISINQTLSGGGGGNIVGDFVPTSRKLNFVGTANQVNILPLGEINLELDRTWTFSLPQDIATNSDVTFNGLLLQGLTASRAVITDASKNLVSSIVTDTELGYLSGVTSSVQSQLNGKEPTISSGVANQFYSWDKTWRTVHYSYLSGVPSSFNPSAHNLLSAYHGDTVSNAVVSGDLIYGNSTPAWSRLPIGNAGDVLTVVGGYPTWQALSGSGITSLNGLTASSQLFADVDDTNVTLTISSVTSTHTFTIGWTGTLAEGRGGTNQSTYAVGDILYASALNTLSKLTIGSAGDVLTVVGGVPTWQAPSGGAHNILSATHTDTSAASVLAGDMIYGNSTPAWARLPAGTDGQFLKMVSGYPAWANHGLTASDVGAVPTSRTLTMVGTTNQISVSPTGAQDLTANRSWTFSTPQDIATTSNVTFATGTFTSGLNVGSNASGAGNGYVYIKNSSSEGYVGLDINEYIRFKSNEWIFRINNANEYLLTGSQFSPYTSGTNSLGAASYRWLNSYIITMYTEAINRNTSGDLAITTTSGMIQLSPSNYLDIDASAIYFSEKSSSNLLTLTTSYSSSAQYLILQPSGGTDRWVQLELKNTYNTTGWGSVFYMWVNNDPTNYQRFIIATQPSANRAIISTDTAGTAPAMSLELKAGSGGWTSISANINLRTSDTQILKNLDFSTGTSLVFGSSYGSRIGTGSGQLIGFFGATPVTQQLATTDLGVVLSNLGFRAAGTAYPITTSGTVTLSGNLTNSASILHTGTAGLGYGTGAGGSVTQLTSKSTGVTLNKICGQITMHNAALAAGAEVSFLLTNSCIAANDNVIVNVKSGATSNTYIVGVEAVSAGSCRILVTNVSGSRRSEAIVLQFSVIKSAIT
jgi:hypothetical protein